MNVMNGHAGRSSAGERVLCLHEQAGVTRAVVLERRAGLRVLAAESFPGSPAESLHALWKAHKPDRVIRVAPSSATVARCATIPAAAAATAEAASAIRLLADAQLPESVPPHRRAGGTLPQSNGSADRVVLLTAWERADSPPAPVEHEWNEAWTTEIAALSMLRRNGSGVALYADPAAGSLSVVASGQARTLARVLRERASSPAEFAQAASAALDETCEAAGVEAPAWGNAPETPTVLLDEPSRASLPQVVGGLVAEPAWLSTFGIAVGAGLVALGEDLTRGLADLRAAPPREPRAPLRSALSWLRVPRHAMIVAATSAAVLLLAPVILAEVRLAILESKSEGLLDRSKALELAARRDALAAQLEKSRWPFAKLLADVSNAAPVGIVLESLSLASEQGLTVRGSASSQGVVDEFQANLNRTRVFRDAKVNRTESRDGRVEFDMVAEVAAPYSRSALKEDFAAKPLAVRLHGEGASNTAPPIAVASASNGSDRRPNRESSSAPERRDRAPSGSGSTGRSTDSTSRPSDSGAPPGEPPPPLTDDQIAKMDRSTAMREMVSRRTFPQRNPTADAATKQRLEEEVNKLREQMAKASSAAPAAPAAPAGAPKGGTP